MSITSPFIPSRSFPTAKKKKLRTSELVRPHLVDWYQIGDLVRSIEDLCACAGASV